MEASKEIAKNSPCPCGSGKKYKRCCGESVVAAAAPLPELPADFGRSKRGAAGFDPSQIPAGSIPGFDPSQLDPQWMNQFSQAMARLPKGQLQRIQGLMQRAMAGKDVSADAAELEKSLPPDFQELMMNFKMPAGLAPETGAETAGEMSEEEARRIVEAAAQAGKLSEDQAAELLQPEGDPNASSETAPQSGLKKLFGFGKKKS